MPKKPQPSILRRVDQLVRDAGEVAAEHQRCDRDAEDAVDEDHADQLSRRAPSPATVSTSGIRTPW